MADIDYNRDSAEDENNELSSSSEQSTRYQTTRLPKKTWHQQMKKDMTGVGVTQDIALDRNEWRRPTPRI